MANPLETKVYRIGKSMIAMEYPDVYFEFVRKLFKEHDDLVRGMVLAQVSLQDGSAFDYLNRMLGTNVTRMMPMELGYAELLDALRFRAGTKLAENAAISLGKDNFKEATLFQPRAEENVGKPLFPDADYDNPTNR